MITKKHPSLTETPQALLSYNEKRRLADPISDVLERPLAVKLGSLQSPCHPGRCRAKLRVARRVYLLLIDLIHRKRTADREELATRTGRRTTPPPTGTM